MEPPGSDSTEQTECQGPCCPWDPVWLYPLLGKWDFFFLFGQMLWPLPLLASPQQRCLSCLGDLGGPSPQKTDHLVLWFLEISEGLEPSHTEILALMRQEGLAQPT